MSDSLGAFWLGVLLTLFVSAMLLDCDRAARTQRYHEAACALSCARNRAGKLYTADETFCTCTNGVALKRDRSRLYVPISNANTPKGNRP